MFGHIGNMFFPSLQAPEVNLFNHPLAKVDLELAIFLAGADKEKFYSVLLDTKNKVIGVDMVSQGSLESAPVAPREVYKAALLASAASVIFIHSHPSGDPEPSFSDIELTRQLKQVGQLMGIQVLDHVIIGRGKFYSFADKGEL